MNILHWFRVRRIKAKVRGAKACLRWIDKQMARLGCPSWKRQQMRRDIVTSDEAWIDSLNLLIDAEKKLTRKQMAGSKRVIRAALKTVEGKDGSGAVLRKRDADMYDVLKNAFPVAGEEKR